MFIINPRDQFLPPQFFEMQNEAIADSKIVAIDSSAGHLICCGGDPKATEIMGSAIAEFLDDLTSQRLSARD
jgi:hypothetical protein